MDRTVEFNNITRALFNEKAPTIRPRLSASPFILRACKMFAQLKAMRKVVDKIFDDYVDYHHHMVGKKSSLKPADRTNLDQEMSLFIATFVSEVHELKRNNSTDSISESNPAVLEHYTEVIAYILDQLSSLNQEVHRMQKERKKYHRNPFLLISSESNKYNIPNLKDLSIDCDDSKSSPLNETSSRSNFEANSSTQFVVKPSLPKSFAERYESEIAPPSKMREYDDLATKHKAILLKETQQLREKFSEEMQEANKMEQTVMGISNMLEEFVRILQLQSDSIEDVHGASKAATKHVEDTSDQLLLTIERSQSHQRAMVSLTIVLALLLLLLDYLTP